MQRLKSKEDLEIMREGGKRHGEILRLLSSMVRPGVTTLELEEEALRLVREQGDEPAHLNYTPRGAARPFPAVLCVSINDEIVHGIPNENVRTLNAGDIVSIDLSVRHKGLITDAAITVPVGEVDAESKRLLHVTQDALAAGIGAAKLGGTTGDIGAAISEIVRLAGFSLAEDLSGHGVGYSVHEDPFVPNVGKKREGERLVAGLVIAIEPMVAVGSKRIKVLKDGYTIATQDGSRSAHFEHTVAITEEGTVVLTR